MHSFPCGLYALTLFGRHLHGLQHCRRVGLHGGQYHDGSVSQLPQLAGGSQGRAQGVQFLQRRGQ